VRAARAETPLTEGYRRCAAITRQYGTTYYWGTLLLPATRRQHVYAVYALCRLADDIVDAPGATEPSQLQDTVARLGRFARTWRETMTGRDDPDDPVLRAVAATARACAIPDECFERFFASMSQDLTTRRYETWEDLLAYMDGSAAVIGEMMLPVLGGDRLAARAPARALGLAFQLTNFLRDVGEDLERGRIYLPQEDLRRFGADPSSRTVTPGWRALMRFEIERNRALYAEADSGIRLLPPASARCVTTARILYARILERIEANDYDVFHLRARVPTWRKAALSTRVLMLREDGNR
jgi:phytoene synthase